MKALKKPSYPFAEDFYVKLITARESFEKLSSWTVPAGRGYGFRIEAGQVVRFVIVEKAQVLDVCLFNADDVDEHYAAGTQVAIEGAQISRLTRIWGTPPRSRPLATCLADTVRIREDSSGKRENAAQGAHCNAHFWLLYTGKHTRNCYDNLREGLSMLGLGQRLIHDNINLFQKILLEPYTGEVWNMPGDAEAGDYIEFYAELPLLMSISLCPQGSGDVDIQDWSETETAVYPVNVEIYETGVTPLGWE